MIQALFRAGLTDAITCLHEAAVFTYTTQKREKQVRTTLGSEYPAALVQYLTTVDADSWAKDVAALMPVVARRDSHVVPKRVQPSVSLLGPRFTLPPGFANLGFSSEMVSDLEALLSAAVPEERELVRNGYVEAMQAACVFDLPEQLLEPAGEGVPLPALDEWMKQVRAHRLEQVVLRELQGWIGAERGVVAPLVQTPLPPDTAVRQSLRKALADRYPEALTCFEVERSLAGGVRVFVDGVMHDASWISQAEHSLEQLHVLS